MSSTPSSTARRNTLSALARSLGSPQISSLPMTRMAPKPRRLTCRSAILSREVTEDSCQAEGDAREALVVELLGGVARAMIVRVAVEGGVGHHDRREAVLAERPVVGPRHAWDEGGRGEALGRESGVLPEGGDRFPYECPRAQIADEGDEVAAVRVEKTQRRRIALAAWRVVVIAE